MVKAIIFDFFDVIHNDPSKAWLEESGVQADDFKAYAKRLDKGEIEIEEFFDRLLELSGQSRESVDKHYAKTRPLDQGMPTFIDSLGKNYKIGLMSNAPSKYLRDIINEHEYDKLFDHVFISGEAGIAKPEAAAFRHVLGKLGVEPSEAIFVDDTKANVEAATNAGIKSLLFTDLENLKSELRLLDVKF